MIFRILKMIQTKKIQLGKRNQHGKQLAKMELVQ
jgi:hypothetical protein